MPYIPRQSEQELIELYNECRSELRAQKGQRSYQEADLEALLYGDMDEALMAVELLKNSNLRQHLDLIAQYLNRECPVLIRALLIDAMMEQDIQVERERIKCILTGYSWNVLRVRERKEIV